MNTWHCLNSGPGPADYNMAVDETLLGAMPRLATPVLRLYGWTDPAASFGYFQKYAEVEVLTPLRPLVRRPTGGGIVPHDADWTYSLAVPNGHWWYELHAKESYRTVHEWLRAAFAACGIDTELAPCCVKPAAGRCFVGHEQSDLLYAGRKIAGAAQRRTREGLLIQGSVQPAGLDVDRAEWEAALRRTVPRGPVEWTGLVLEPELVSAIGELVTAKYSLADYIRKR